jgi:heme ABC exporter ATP-binding subunit CcmA
MSTAISIEHIWKFYGDFPALRDITLPVETGQCTALLGRNGAGKTTLLRIVAGLSRAAKGRVTIFGDDVRKQETRARIGVLGHAIGIYDELSAIENLKLFARLYDIADPDAAASKWLERVGLERVATGLVREFSRGMRQRLAVARAFLHDPQVLLLDEPFTALDDKAIAVLQTVLREAIAEGKTVMMSTHQLREALELATHVALVVRGRIAYHGDRTHEMLADPTYLYRTYGEA